MDAQTAMGKAPVGVAKLAKKYHKPVIAFAGGIERARKRATKPASRRFSRRARRDDIRRSHAPRNRGGKSRRKRRAGLSASYPAIRRYGMHDIWNPWHGCVKCSEGCAHCYMYFLDSQRGHNGAEIYRTKTGFHYPLSRDRAGNYKVKSGEQLRVCMTSDFFLEQADPWRREAWEIMDQRRDISFFLLTKRPERVEKCLPYNWGDGWEHIFFNVTCENQRRADERIPMLHSLPFKHKGIMTAPLLGPIEIENTSRWGRLSRLSAAAKTTTARARAITTGCARCTGSAQTKTSRSALSRRAQTSSRTVGGTSCRISACKAKWRINPAYRIRASR